MNRVVFKRLTYKLFHWKRNCLPWLHPPRFCQSVRTSNPFPEPNLFGKNPAISDKSYHSMPTFSFPRPNVHPTRIARHLTDRASKRHPSVRSISKLIQFTSTSTPPSCPIAALSVLFPRFKSGEKHIEALCRPQRWGRCAFGFEVFLTILFDGERPTIQSVNGMAPFIKNSPLS